MKRASFPVAVLLAVALVLLWVGERVFEVGTGRLVLSWAGVGLAVLSALWRFSRVRSSSGGANQVEKALFGLQIVALAALAMYFAQSDALARLDGAPLSAQSPKLSGCLSALWPAVMAMAVLPICLMELSYAAMAKSVAVEVGRVRDAMFSGLGAAGLVIFAFCAQYVASERDHKVVLSYFRTTKPGEATKRLVQSFTEPVLVALFFPPSNEVSEQAQAYFDELKADSRMLQVQLLDHAIEPVRAKDLGVSGNGVVVLSKGGRHESIHLGTELESSKGQLRGLDQEVQKRLLQVAGIKKTLYLTSGHGERSEESLNTVDQRATIAKLYSVLRGQNYEVKTLSAAEGLGQEIPKDAAAVMVLGPTRAFQDPEAKAVDPENAQTFSELLTPLGRTFAPVVLANDVAYARKSYTESDKTIIGTKTFSSHPAVTTNGRAGYPVFFNQAGSLDELPTHPAELSIDFAVRAEPSTWNDLNNNYRADVPPEVRKSWGVVAAVTRRKTGSAKIEDELRALVLADSDAIGDEILSASPGNAYLLIDGLKWLFGDELLAGTVNEESDVPITRTRQQDVAWFYSTTFLAPVAMLGMGMLLRRRKKGGAR